MNPDTLNYAVNPLDDAMLDRFVSVEVTANLADYITYSQKTGPCDDVLDYLTACPDMLLRVKMATEQHRHL
jgi:predicted Zn-dependent protease